LRSHPVSDRICVGVLPRRPAPLEIVCAIAPLLTQSPRWRSSAPPA
jgi:hypothetical protein